ncbi:MAG: histidinol-phosphatase HisJ family protein [Clostridiales bacterium]|jgi:histidinol-phosphatase (PHP family)|nr:histidinol-phosphatase HisJ family protein [Clostridiales bacterium]
MILTDFHTHSYCSDDGVASMHDMALAGAERGVSIMCITDHVDIDHFETGGLNPDCFSHWDRIKEEYALAVERLGGCIDLRLGIEFGEANHAPGMAQSIAEAEGLDFIIGSLHNLWDYPDFFCIRYKSEQECRELAKKYVEEHFELVRLGCLDVLGHIGYAKRYMKRRGFDIGLEGLEDRLEALFKLVSESGKGIELNTSGLRDNTGTTFPEKWVLKLYREAGGEIITVGSDSHRPEDVGANIEDAYELLREVGFKYFTVFKNRKPEFIKL